MRLLDIGIIIVAAGSVIIGLLCNSLVELGLILAGVAITRMFVVLDDANREVDEIEENSVRWQ